MRNPEFVLEELLAHDAWVRSLAARLVADPDGGEDVAQDAWVAALENPPRRRSGVRSWLRRVVRSRVVTHRRSRRRRIEREHRAARPDRLPSVGEILAEEETRRRVVDAVCSLEEPYRSAILHRYFRDLPVREIARFSEVSRSAVEKRITRGLHQLRARLDRDFGDRRSWCSALLPLIGPPPVEAATASATLATGALVMSTKIKVGLAVLAALAVAYVFLCREEVRPPEARVGRTVPPTTVRAPESGGPSAEKVEAGNRALVQSREPSRGVQPPGDSRPSDTITLRGRCVSAETGQPLAGCRVAVAGTGSDTVDVEDHEARHGPMHWANPRPHRTGSDGRFAIAFRPVPPFEFTLSVLREGMIPVDAHFRRLDPGPDKNLGDVCLSTGARMSGRVIDTEGIPQDRVQLYLFHWPSPEDEEAHSRRRLELRTRPDGTFSVPHPVSPGTWKVSLPARYLERPEELVIDEGVRIASLEIVVKKLDAITGAVVDEEGAPVSGARIAFHPGGSLHRYRTDADGSFRLERPPGRAQGPVALSVVKDGHELIWRRGSYAWGTTGVRLVLPRGRFVEIQAIDGETLQPVERFGVRCFAESRPGDSLFNQDQCRRQAGEHPGGKVKLAGVRRGVNLLMVEPLDRAHAPSLWQRISVGDARTPPVSVKLFPLVRRTLLVTGHDGPPVAGTEVELVRPVCEQPVTLRSPVGRPSLLRYEAADRLSLLLQRGSTDDSGRFELSGPCGEQLALRLIGPGHVPRVVNDVLLDPSLGPLRVRVDRGATLTGTIRPLEALRQLGPGPPRWKHDPSQGDGVPTEAEFAPKRPAVYLVPADARRASGSDRRAERTAVPEDGRFTLTGVSPGSWKVYLNYSETPGPGMGRRFQSKLLATVENLQQGETRHLDLSIADLLEGRVTGRVYLNGTPLGNGTLEFPVVKPDRRGGTRLVRTSIAVKTGENGDFTARLPSGRYQLEVRFRLKDGSRGTSLRSRDAIVMPPGGTLQRDFSFVSAKLALRVLGSDGRTPVKGVRLYALIPEQRYRFYTPKSDPAGRITLDAVPPGKIHFAVWPKHIRTTEAMRAFQRLHKSRWRAALPTLAVIEVGADTREITRDLVMPAESGY